MKNSGWMSVLSAIVVSALLVGLPLLGVVWRGEPPARYLEFPPLTQYVAHAPFAWPAFLALAAAIVAVLAPVAARVIRSPRAPAAREPRALQSTRRAAFLLLPGLLLIAASWTLAWTRWPAFAPLQLFTFTPLWLGYILVVNGLTQARAGRCMLHDRPRFFLALFPVSAAFWWFFEYLNRFVQNWYYVGIDALSPLQYALFATLPFSTVLPAVLGTEDLLATVPRLTAGLDGARPLRIPAPRAAAAAALLAASAGLAAISVYPDLLFPLLWIAPFALITALQALRGRPTLFAPLRRGDWSRLVRLALAALVCGFFWELWNVRSAAKWIYAVPYVQRFHLFEMPLLGYAGYLPFGLECAVIGDAVRSWLDRRRRGTPTPTVAGTAPAGKEQHA